MDKYALTIKQIRNPQTTIYSPENNRAIPKHLPLSTISNLILGQ